MQVSSRYVWITTAVVATCIATGWSFWEVHQSKHLGMFFVGTAYPLFFELVLLALLAKRGTKATVAAIFAGWALGNMFLPNF